MKVTIFKDSATVETVVEFNEVLNAIRKGNKQEYQFAPSGVISDRKKNTLIYSGLVLLTFNTSSEEELDNLFQRVIEMSTTYCCFRNHLGNGLDVLIKTDCRDGHHKTGYKQVFEAYQNTIDLVKPIFYPDEKVLCQLSYDPNIYFNPDCRYFQVEIRTKLNLISEISKDALYKETFEEQVEYTERIVKFECNQMDTFIYTLAKNCCSVGIPEVKTLELIMQEYGLNRIIKGLVTRAYRNNKQTEDADKMALFSVYLKNLKNYKDDVSLIKRVLFEFFIITYIQFRGQLNFSENQFKQELGISFARLAVIKEFQDSGFLNKGKINVLVGNKKVPKNTFSINPDMLPIIARKYMTDSTEFVSSVMPLLKAVQNASDDFNTSYLTS